jgi:hypothetical protein
MWEILCQGLAPCTAHADIHSGCLLLLLVCFCSTHPHRDAEIFSYVLEGQLTHQDSMGNRESLSRGAVQYLSAGSGITHSVSAGSWDCRRALGPPCLLVDKQAG